MPPAHRFVLARIALHLRPIQAHPPHPQHSQGLRQHQNLLEQPLQLIQKPLAKVRYRVMIRMLASGDVAKRHRVVRRLLQLAAGEHPGGVAVEQQRYQHGRMIRSLAATTGISAGYFTELELLYNFHYKARQMLFRKPLLNGRRQEHRCLPIERAELVCHEHPVC